MPEFRTVARVGDLPEGTARAIDLGKKVIALFHRPGGVYLAIDDTCPHMGASLAQGRVDEQNVVHCPWHAWRFRLTDGCWMNSPRLKVGSYPVQIRGDEIQVAV